MAATGIECTRWFIALWLVSSSALHPARAEPAALNTAHVRLRGPTGHPCLDFQMFVRPQIINPDEFDHTVQIRNSCLQPIQVKLCYKNSKTGCRKLRIRPYGQATALLGSMFKKPDFSFEYTEEFDDTD